MILYLSIIGIAVFVICSANLLFNEMISGFSFVWIIVVAILAVVIEIAIDGLCAWVAHSLPNKFYDKDKKVFHVGKKERKFYDKLHIKNWKDKVWELGALGGFRKNKVSDPNNPKYLNLFIVECNKGFAGHTVSVFLGFLILLFPMSKYWLCLGLPVALVNALLNLMSSCVLRYNVPKLTIAYQRALKNQELHKKIEEKIIDKNEINNDEKLENKKQIV